MRAGIVAVVLLGCLAAPIAAQPPLAPDHAQVNANGNAFVPGSLNFDPDRVRVRVGGIVHWTNTDQTVPHTSTEDHGLWRLSGTYGSPGPYQGYGPGETVQRTFEAGTHHYYCEVHPNDMRAVVAVPVTLTKRSGKVTAKWAASAPKDGLVFDVQRRKGSGKWGTLLSGTTTRRTSFALAPRGTRWTVRARLRSAKDKSKATDWSPPVSVQR